SLAQNLPRLRSSTRSLPFRNPNRSLLRGLVLRRRTQVLRGGAIGDRPRRSARGEAREGLLPGPRSGEIAKPDEVRAPINLPAIRVPPQKRKNRIRRWSRPESVRREGAALPDRSRRGQPTMPRIRPISRCRYYSHIDRQPTQRGRRSSTPQVDTGARSGYRN